MTALRITIGDLHCTARWADGAPRTPTAIRALLPLRSKLIHVRWSGEGTWIPFGEAHLDIGPETATSHPAPGDLIIYPGGISECEILLAYGAVDLLEQGRPAVGQPLRDDHGGARAPAGDRATPYL